MNEIRSDYKKHIDCIKNQYSGFRVTEVEQYFKIPEVRLHTNKTIKEDFADISSVKIAYRAYKKFIANPLNANKSEISIGLSDFTQDQLFWISFAQTYCSTERPTRTKNNLENSKYSLDKFRVIGPLSNLEEFARSFNCPKNSRMVRSDDEKCKLF